MITNKYGQNITPKFLKEDEFLKYIEDREIVFGDEYISDLLSYIKELEDMVETLQKEVEDWEVEVNNINATHEREMDDLYGELEIAKQELEDWKNDLS